MKVTRMPSLFVITKSLGINEASSSKITALLLRHFSEISKPRDSVLAAYDDHGLSVDNAVDADLDLLYLPPEQSDEENDSIPLRTAHCGSATLTKKSPVEATHSASSFLITGPSCRGVSQYDSTQTTTSTHVCHVSEALSKVATVCLVEWG